MNPICRKAIRDAIALLAIIAPVWAHSADLEVINDGKGSVPAAIYYAHLLSGVDQPGVLAGVRFPIRSLLTPGAVNATSEPSVFDARWLGQPIFVIGTDEASAEWLKRHLETLNRMGAAGLVIAAASEAAFKTVQALAGPLPLSPVTDDWLEQRLTAAHITHFPLLIMGDGRITGTPGQESAR